MKRICILMMMILGACGLLTAQSYRVGDLYTAPDGSQGIVFHLFPDGTGGWVVALNDASASCAWGDAADIPGLENQNVSYYQMLLNDTSGYTNTQLIRNYQNNSAYAAGVVDFEHGWYLPSPAQLRMLHAIMPRLVNVFADANGTGMSFDWYWCSAEQNDTEAWQVDFGHQAYHGHFHLANKSSLCHVRAVRTFTYGPNYVWSSGQTTASITVAPEESTVYTVTAYSTVGYTDADSVEITALPHDTVTLFASSCDSYLWYGDTLTQSGIYTHTLTNVMGCDSVEVLNLTVIPVPTLNHTPDTVILAGTSANLWASGADYLYWIDSNDSILSSGNSLTVSPEATTTYYIGGQNVNAALDGDVVENGDFEQGNTGFYSDYTYVTGYNMGAGRYSVTTDGILVWGSDHLYGFGGSGQFMVVDGAMSPNSIIWQQTVQVTPHTYYAFSAQVASTLHSNSSNSYALLQFSVNSDQIGDIFHSPDVLNVWQPYYEVWYSGNNTSATLTILNQNTDGSGNDFGLDEISFTPLTECSVTDSILVAVIGYPDNVDSADCVFFPEGTEWGIGQPLISSASAITVSTPMVGDIDDDGQQEIVALAGNNTISSTINIFNADATLKSQFSTNSFYIWNSVGLAKVKWQENEYKNIIVVLGTNKRLYAYDAQGTQLWQSNATFATQYNESTPLPSVSFADFNHDGWAEIYIGADIYDAATGVLLCRASGNKGYSGRTWSTQNNVYHTIAADLCGDYNLELAVGNTIYAVDIQSRTDFNANQMTVVREVPSSAMKMEDNSSIPFSDGNTYLADMNLDGRLDVLVMNVDQPNRVLYLYVWDVETQSIICSKKIGNTRKFGTPQIGDINQDGYDEICFITGTYSAHSTGSNDLIYALQYNPQNSNGAMDVFWTTPHSDNSACTGLTLFDFNQDGIAELIYRDRFNLRIINGSLIHHQTGEALTQPYDMAVSPCGSATGIEYPLVVDVDLDGEAEIVVGGATSETDFGHLYIFNSSGEPWAPARKVWNQYMYNVTNVNEDLTIPQYLFNNATVFTDPEGVVRRPFNNFQQQATSIDQYGRPFYAVPDVAIGSSASLQMTSDNLTLAFSYCNIGDNALNAPYIVTIFANTYGGDTVCTVTMNESLPVDSCVVNEILLPISVLCGFPNLDSLVIAVNCAGTGIAQNGEQQPECDTTNNTAAVAITLHADTTILTETSCESYIWYGETLTQSGIYTHTLTNVMGCDSVEVLNLTVIPVPTLNHTPDTVILAGTSANLWASGADYLYWIDSNDSILSSNPFLTVSPAISTMYYVAGQNMVASVDDNLVYNGDFEMGNEGFTSEYYYSTNLWPNGYYYVGPNAHNYHPGFYNWPDHTTGTGNYMIINGSELPNTNVWTQTVAVTPNTNYAFSTWVCSVGGTPSNPAELARLQFSVNGMQLGNVFTAPNVYGVWSHYYEVWNSGNNTSATLTILNQHTAGGGNDFGIDDISFFPLTECSVTDSILVAVIGYPDNVQDIDCVFPPDSNAFEMVELFQTPNVNSMSTPMVADMDGDGLPEIIACCYTYSAPYFSTGFHVVNGQTGELKYTISTVQYVNSGQMVTIADVDHDGKSELFLLGRDMKLYCYNYNGGVRWASANTVDKNYLLSAADVNNDGNAEIVCGKYIYDAQTGVLLLEGSMVETGMGYGVPHGVSLPYHVPYYMYALGDVDNDGTLEVCAGNTVYKMNVSNANGTTGNTWSILRQADTPAGIVNKDGQTFLVDFDNDGDFDICVIGVTHTLNNQTFSHIVDVYVWDGQTSQVIAHSPLQVNGHFGASIPYSGDLNGDGLPEIIFAVPNVGMLAYTYDTTTSSMSLMHNHAPFAETSGFTVFDFNQDGQNEIVYRGTSQLFIVDGVTLENLCAPITAYSGTITEYPVVADVNADGHAEIIVTRAYNSWSSGNANGWVSVYGSLIPGAWSSARKVWNQWAYNSVNINEDLTVPQYRFDVSTTFPNGKKPFNSFLRQMPYIDSQGDLFNAVADVAVSGADAIMQNNSVTLSLSYCNIGDNALFTPYIVTIFANTYGGDTVCTVTMNESLPVDSCVVKEIQLPISMLCGFPNLDTLVIAVNCAGTGIAQNGGQQPECDTTNNTAAVAITLHADTTILTETSCDSYLWYGDTLTQSGIYTHTLTNVMGCDSLVTLNLTVNHSTASTLQMTVQENNLPYLLDGVPYSEPGDYTQTLTNAAGCDSVVTLHLTVYYNQTVEVDSTVCDSELPIMWNGVTFTSAGTQTATLTMANGADSLITMTLHVNPSTSSTLDIAVVQNNLPYLLNGSSYNAAGTYTQSFTNAAGCDSTLTLHLTVYGNITVQLDSVVCANALPLMWNDSLFTAAGTKTTVLTASSGADSTVVMTLTVNPQPTAEISGITALCSGATATLTAGSATSYLWNTGATTQTLSVSQAGTYTLTVTNSFGCQASTYHQLNELTNPILSADIPEMCAGGTYTLTVGHQHGVDNILLGHGETTLSLADTIFLPDGIYCEPYGCSYQSPLTFTAYAPGDTIQNAEDIYYVRVNIEHTFMGDLYINITCPNGQKADLLKYGGNGMSDCNAQISPSSRGWATGDNMFVGTYLGDAHVGSTSSCDPSFPGNEPGVGWNYCWSNNTTQGYTYAYGQGSYIYRVGNEHNGKVDSSNVAAGTQFYHPDDSFSNLIGCPLNGDWYIEVQDGWNIDNGYLFGWELALSTEMLTDRDFTLDHATSDGPWISNVTDSTFVVEPPADLAHDTVIAYTFTVYDVDGCSFDTTVNLTFYALPYTELDTAVCDSLVWNDSLYTESGEFEWHYPGVHCDSTFVLRVTVNSLFEETFEDEVCEGSGYQNHGLTVPPMETVGVDSLTKVFNLQTVNGCDSTVTLHLTIVDTALRIVSLTPDFCENMTAELMVETPMPDYVWSTGEMTPTIWVTMPGYYTVTATQGSCSVTARYMVQACHYELYLPNAISPTNVDGLNDFFSIPEFNAADMALFEISIFNRWGEMVFYSTDKYFKWDGEYRGTIQLQTVYTYVIKYTDTSGRPHRVTGSLTVL